MLTGCEWTDGGQGEKAIQDGAVQCTVDCTDSIFSMYEEYLSILSIE